MSLPQNNTPMPPDYLAVSDFSWENNGPFTIPAGTTMNFPTEYPMDLPPVYGSGTPRVPTRFAFDVVSGQFAPGQVIHGIGVSNPSEFDQPMRPFDGGNYVTAFTEIGHNEMERDDQVIAGFGQTDFRSWTMNSASPNPKVRADWPSLSPYITNNSGNTITVVNVQIISTVER